MLNIKASGMIYPKKNRIMFLILYVYTRYILNRHFYNINFNNVEIEQNRSILLIANHFSIWDGLILYWVTRKNLRKKFHVMLLEATSKKESMLKYGGAFSINKGSRNIIESLNYAAELLHDPQNLVLVFPQGKLYSNFINDIYFEKGIMKIMENARDKFQLIYAATFIENFQYKKPTANVYLNADTNGRFEAIEDLKNSYQQHYSAAKLQQTKKVL
jgi:1-acyl-sn-glycerol-3-phosphate acyltransferase